MAKRKVVATKIEKGSGFLEETVNELRRNAGYDQESQELLEKMEHLLEIKKNKKTKADIKEAMNATCWGSLSYCCSLKRGCPYCLAVLDALGIPKAKFRKMKESIDWAGV